MPEHTAKERRSSDFLKHGGRGVLIAILLFAVGSALQTLDLAAQGSLSTIRGTVFDQTGAVVPGVEVTVTDLNTNISRGTITDDVGNYEVVGLQPGRYRMEVRMPGFRNFVVDGLVLESSQIRRLDARLEVGEEDLHITVTAGAALIEKEEGKIAATVTAEQFEDAPLIGGIDRFNPNMMLGTLPGVQMDEHGRNMNLQGISGGNQIEQGMDGAPTPGMVNQVNNMFDVEEVRLVTQNATADQPRAASFNLVTKRGHNTFGGNIYYYHQNSALDAREYFADTKHPTKLHNFGAQAAGPIVRDKTFFFAAYNAVRHPAGNFFLTDVPTEKMRAGDFSEFLGLPSPVQIRDPLTGEPFANNVIPSNRLNPLSQRMQEGYIPRPNREGVDLLTRNFAYLHPYPFDLYRWDDHTVRIDHKLSENNELMGRFIQRWIPYVLPRSYPGLEWTRLRRSYHVTVSDTHVFTPQLVNTFRFGWYAWRIHDGTEVDGFQPLMGDQVVQELGLQGVNPGGLSSMGFPRTNITGYSPLQVQPGGRQGDDLFNWANSTIWTVGQHTLKFGLELRHNQHFNDYVPEGTYGTFNFNGAWTGNAHADFLLGIPFSSQRIEHPLVDRRLRSHELGLYITDTYKVHPRLTLDVGIRWDYFGPTTVKDNLQWNWDPATGNVVVPRETFDQVSPLYPTDTINVVAGDVAVKPQKTNFAPRLGAAFRLNDLTVLRGGYGIFNEFYGVFANANWTGGPFQLTETFLNEIQGGQPLFAFPNPFPALPGAVPSQSVSGYPVNPKNGYIQQFNLTLERQIGDLGFSASYMGTRAGGLRYNLMINKPEPSLIPFSQSRRPFPQFISASFFQDNGRSKYDGLTVRGVRRTGQVTFDVHWTWANNMHNFLQLENPHNPNLWNRDNMVANHRVVGNIAWRIPVGRQRQFLADLPPVANAILGGWRMNWIAYFQTGQWFSPSFSGSDPSNTNTFSGLPDRLADGNLPGSRRTTEQWFDVGAFADPEPGRFGNSGVNILEGPRRHVHNVSIAKEFAATERFTVEYQAVITNVFNIPNFARPAGPGANITVPAAGQVQSVVGLFNQENGYPRKMEMRLKIKW